MKTFWKFVYWARYYGNEGLSGHCAISRISEPSEEGEPPEEREPPARGREDLCEIGRAQQSLHRRSKTSISIASIGKVSRSCRKK